MRLVKTILTALAILVVTLAAILASYLWWSYPKRPISGVLVREARAPIFRFSDIPKGHALSAREIDGYAQRLIISRHHSATSWHADRHRAGRRKNWLLPWGRK